MVVQAIEPSAIDQNRGFVTLVEGSSDPNRFSHQSCQEYDGSVPLSNFQQLLESSYPAVTSHLKRYTGEDFDDTDKIPACFINGHPNRNAGRHLAYY